jgi:hypothetical protein
LKSFWLFEGNNEKISVIFDSIFFKINKGKPKERIRKKGKTNGKKNEIK